MKKAIEGTKVIFSFKDGLAPVVFDATRAHADNRAYAEMHGWQQRIGDAAAIPREQPDGTVITVTEAMRREAILELVNHYESGAARWALREAGAPKAAKQSPVILALAAKRGCTYEEAEAYIAAQFLNELGTSL